MAFLFFLSFTKSKVGLIYYKIFLRQQGHKLIIILHNARVPWQFLLMNSRRIFLYINPLINFSQPCYFLWEVSICLTTTQGGIITRGLLSFAYFNAREKVTFWW